LSAWQRQLGIAHRRRREAEQIEEGRQKKRFAAQDAFEDVRQSALDLTSVGNHLHESASFSEEMSACSEAFKSMQDFVADLQNANGLRDCWHLRDQVSHSHDQLGHLKDMREHLEDRVKDVEEQSRELERRKKELASLLPQFERAVANDPTSSISESTLNDLVNAAHGLEVMARVELANVAATVREARSVGDAIVAKGTSLYDDTAAWARSAPCRRD